MQENDGGIRETLRHFHKLFLKNCFQLRRRELPELSGSQRRVQGEGTDPLPVQRRHVLSPGGEHTLDLMILSLVYCHMRQAGSNELQRGGETLRPV